MEQPPTPDTTIGWRVVVASLLLPLAWVVTNSLALTIIVAGFGTLLLAQSHPAFAELVNDYPPLRWINLIAPFVVLFIFITALLRAIVR